MSKLIITKQMQLNQARQILQLLAEGVPQSKICGMAHCSKRTVSAIKKMTVAAGKSNAEMLVMQDGELKQMLEPQAGESRTDEARKCEMERMMPEIVKRLNRRHANVQFVYEDYYRKECPDGYGYTQFKKYVGIYRERHDYSYHNQYEPGCEWQIDFAGDPLYLVDAKTKEKTKLTVLVCVMPYSNLPFMMALPKATTEWFYHGLNKGLEYMGAVPQVAKSDNMKQWVSKSDRYSLDFSRANVEWCSYYGIEPTACRVRKPRDKGPVEGAVNQLYKYVYARIEGEEHNTLDSINERIMELLDEYCSLPYRGSSRREIFEAIEKPAMKPLPGRMFSLRLRKVVKLGSSYHVCIGPERHFYSVPYKYVGQEVKVMWDAETVEVYADCGLVCMHPRSMVKYGYSTEASHMPEEHKAYERCKEMNATKLLEWGECIGANAKWAVESLLEHTTFPQQAYGRCSGLLSLAKKYGKYRLDRACGIMKERMGSSSYKTVRKMLEKGMDTVGDNGEKMSRTPINDNVRGASAYTFTTILRKEDCHD